MRHRDTGLIVAALLAAVAVALALCLDTGGFGGVMLQASGLTFAVAALIEAPP